MNRVREEKKHTNERVWHILGSNVLHCAAAIWKCIFLVSFQNEIVDCKMQRQPNNVCINDLKSQFIFKEAFESNEYFSINFSVRA